MHEIKIDWINLVGDEDSRTPMFEGKIWIPNYVQLAEQIAVSIADELWGRHGWHYQPTATGFRYDLIANNGIGRLETTI